MGRENGAQTSSPRTSPRLKLPMKFFFAPTLTTLPAIGIGIGHSSVCLPSIGLPSNQGFCATTHNVPMNKAPNSCTRVRVSVKNPNQVIDGLIGHPHSPNHLMLPLKEALLFYKDPLDERLCLCVLKLYLKDIFKLTHN